MSLFDPIFLKVPNAWQAILCLFIITVYSLIFSFIYTKIKKMDGYHKDTPIVMILLPIIITGLMLGITSMIYNFTESDTKARYARYGAAIFGALLILRIRSEQRTPEVIVYYLFLIGIAFLVGLGYLLYSLFLFFFVLLILLLLHIFKFPRSNKRRILLKIKIPEDINYENVFDDVFNIYCEEHKLVKVNTSDLGTLFTLRYEILLKKEANQKSFIDALRVKNSNLDIILINNMYEE